MPSSIHRRNFLAGTVASGLAVGLHRTVHAATDSTSNEPGPNNTIRVACIGVRGRGKSHIAELEKIPGVNVVALCDIDKIVLANEATKFQTQTGRKVKRFIEYHTYLGRKREPGPSAKSNTNPFERFIAGVRSRSHKELGVEIEDGHLSSALCHLGNISYRLKRSLEFDPRAERFVSDDQADAMLTRDYRKPFVVPAVQI